MALPVSFPFGHWVARKRRVACISMTAWSSAWSIPPASAHPHQKGHGCLHSQSHHPGPHHGGDGGNQLPFKYGQKIKTSIGQCGERCQGADDFAIKGEHGRGNGGHKNASPGEALGPCSLPLNYDGVGEGTAGAFVGSGSSFKRKREAEDINVWTRNTYCLRVIVCVVAGDCTEERCRDHALPGGCNGVAGDCGAAGVVPPVGEGVDDGFAGGTKSNCCDLPEFVNGISPCVDITTIETALTSAPAIAGGNT